MNIKKIIAKCIISLRKPIDLLLAIVIIIPGFLMLFFRRVGAKRLPLTSRVLKKIGVWVIRDHYYEPLFNMAHLSKTTNEPRSLPGLDLKDEEQLAFLRKLSAGDEFKDFVRSEEESSDPDKFTINNDSFGSGDSDFLYQFIRCIKPKKIFEIGSGNSTKVAQRALVVNQKKDHVYSKHICLEPYEQTWLEKYPGIELVREKVELYDTSWSEELDSGDLLFIDSSHMIRPQGDVLFEYLNIIPQLKSGVYIHVHDIFTPRDYLDTWLKQDVLFWNEQYLLEAILSNVTRYQTVASLNHLKHSYYEELKSICPYLSRSREPGSFYFKVI